MSAVASINQVGITPTEKNIATVYSYLKLKLYRKINDGTNGNNNSNNKRK